MAPNVPEKFLNELNSGIVIILLNSVKWLVAISENKRGLRWNIQWINNNTYWRVDPACCLLVSMLLYTPFEGKCQILSTKPRLSTSYTWRSDKSIKIKFLNGTKRRAVGFRTDPFNVSTRIIQALFYMHQPGCKSKRKRSKSNISFKQTRSIYLENLACINNYYTQQPFYKAKTFQKEIGLRVAISYLYLTKNLGVAK